MEGKKTPKKYTVRIVMLIVPIVIINIFLVCLSIMTTDASLLSIIIINYLLCYTIVLINHQFLHAQE